MDDQNTSHKDEQISSETVPLTSIAKSIETPPAKTDTATELHEFEKKTTEYEKSTLRWSKVAVFMSSLAALFVCLQWLEMRGSSGDTHALAIDAGNQATAATTQSRQAFEQTKKMAESIAKTEALIKATNRLANSSDRQSRITAKELELSERPWVFFDASITSPLTFDSSGARVGVRIVSRNTGHSPAAGISWQVKIIPFIPVPNAVGERERICKETEMQQAVNERTSYMLFPGGDIQQDWVLKMDRGDIERTTKVNVGFITPTVIACVVYHPTFTKVVYRTARIYNVFTVAPHTGATFPIKAMENGTVPIEIGMFQHFAGGIYGD